MVLLEVKDIKRYRGPAHILRGVSIHVDADEVVALVGRNGAGRTTIIESITGLLAVRSGQIRFRDEDITSLPPHRRAKRGIGYAPENSGIFPELTVAENLMISRWLAAKTGRGGAGRSALRGRSRRDRVPGHAATGARRRGGHACVARVKAVTPSKSRRNRKPPSAALMVAAAGILVTVARAGHELPVYPSYYPHEIAIETMAPQRAADLLRDNKLHAYLGPQPPFPGDMPASIRAAESLGSFVIVRLNPASSAARDGSSACATIETILRGIARRGGFLLHPHPATPLPSDSLYFAVRPVAAAAPSL